MSQPQTSQTRPRSIQCFETTQTNTNTNRTRTQRCTTLKQQRSIRSKQWNGQTQWPTSTKANSPSVFYTKRMPDIESLMQVWPQEVQDLLSEISVPSEEIDLSLEEYSRVACNIVDIPVHKDGDNNVIESLVMLTLFSAFKENQPFSRITSPSLKVLDVFGVMPYVIVIILLMDPSSEGNTIHFDVLINGVQTKVKVNKDILETRDIRINVYDMIGLKKSAQKKEEHSYTFYYYPKLKKWLKQPQRYLQSLDFTVLDTDQWIEIEDRLISLIYNRPIGTSLKLLIFFNPTSGSNSKSHLSRILNFLNYTNMEPYIINTTHRNHCLEYLRNYNKASNGDNEYCGIAIVSGDGLMHEYVNSLCQIPVTHVPAGSGNAFARTQMFWARELCKDEESIFLVVKNRLRKFSLAKYELEKIEQPVYSFLSLQWAMFADLDINSEFLRCLGILRFEVYAAWLLLRYKSYLAKLSYSTIQSKIPNLGTDLDKNPNYHSLRTNFAHTIFCMIPFISEKHKIAPVLSNTDEDPFIDMQVLEHQSGRYQLLKYLLSSETGSHFDLQEERPTDGYAFIHRKVKSFRLEPLDDNQPGVFCIDGEMYESQKLQASLPGDKYFMAFC